MDHTTRGLDGEPEPEHPDHPTDNLAALGSALPDHTTRRLDGEPAPEHPEHPDHPTTKLPAHLPETGLTCLRCHTPLVPTRIVPPPPATRPGVPAFYLEQTDGFLIGRGPARTSLAGAWVCPDCGYTEFYAADPHKLRNHKRDLAP